jgi:hypothetical protein
MKLKGPNVVIQGRRVSDASECTDDLGHPIHGFDAAGRRLALICVQALFPICCSGSCALLGND